MSLLLAAEEMSGSRIAWSLVIAAVLILLNGLFVAWEFAVLAARRATIEAGAADGSRRDQAALAALSDLSNQLAGAQLGITMASLGLGYVGEPTMDVLLHRLFGQTFSEEVTTAVSFVVALGVVSYLHLVVGEMVPKNIAIASPEPTVRWLVYPYRAYLWLFRPAIAFLNGAANAGCRLLGVEPRDELSTGRSVAELAAIVQESRAEGAIEDDDAQLLYGALEFAERPVGDVAIALGDLGVVRAGATVAQVEQVVRDHDQVRIPVRAATGALVGYFHAKDLLDLPVEQRSAPVPTSRIRRMARVRADQSLVVTLRTMRRLNRHLAVVVDENGTPQGVVSLDGVVRALIPAGLQQQVAGVPSDATDRPAAERTP